MVIVSRKCQLHYFGTGSITIFVDDFVYFGLSCMQTEAEKKEHFLSIIPRLAGEASVLSKYRLDFGNHFPVKIKYASALVHVRASIVT
jgi:hypothetical protein